MTEKWVGERVIRIAEVGMIEDAEELGAEMECNFLREVKLALEGHLRLRGVAPKRRSTCTRSRPASRRGGAPRVCAP